MGDIHHVRGDVRPPQGEIHSCREGRQGDGGNGGEEIHAGGNMRSARDVRREMGSCSKERTRAEVLGRVPDEGWRGGGGGCASGKRRERDERD